MNSGTDGNESDPGMGHTFTNSYVYFDDRDKEVPPEAEGSFLMAIGMTEEISSTFEGGIPTGDPTHAHSNMILEDYKEDQESFETNRRTTLGWLEANSQPFNPNNDPVLAETNLVPAESEAAAGVWSSSFDDDDDGMRFSREATANEDEPWILEKILRRRVYKCKSTSVRELQYLCLWKYYAEPTWEPRALLEDEGFKAACDIFDGVKELQTGGVQKGRGSQLDVSKATHGLEIERQSALETVFGNHITVEIQKAMRNVHIQALYYMSVAVPSRVQAFVATWRRLEKTHRPTLLFHGTNSKNIISIVKNGLVVPGNLGVTVANGSVHGVGIYTSNSPSTPAGYCNNRNLAGDYSSTSGEMFACIGLVSNKDPQKIKVACSGSYLIFFDSSYVIPVGLVGWRRSGDVVASSCPLPRRCFNRSFDPNAPVACTVARQNPQHKVALRALSNAAAAGEAIPAEYVAKPMTKRMLKECPRRIKDLYRAGALTAKNSEK